MNTTVKTPYHIFFVPCDSIYGEPSSISFETEKERSDFLNDPGNADWICEWQDWWTEEN